VLEFDLMRLSCLLAAGEPHIGDFRKRRTACNAGETAFAQDRAFEGELRGDADPHLIVGWGLSGLEVEDCVAPVSELLDAVGACGQAEAALAERNGPRAADFHMRVRHRGAALALEAHEPARDRLEAR